MRITTIVIWAACSVLPTQALHLVKRDNPRVVSMQIHRRTEPKIFTSPSLRKRQNTVSQTLDNFEDGSLYFANMTMGTPPQTFRFHIDTGSSDLWTNVPDSQVCLGDTADSNSGDGDFSCSISGTYVANDSSTYKYVNSDFEIQYADGSDAAGDYVTDTVRIGGIDLTNQQFGVGYTSTSAQGVLGIGYVKLEAQYQNALQEGSNPTTYANIPQTMVDQGHINSNAYSLWLDDIYSATGNILFGGVDSDKYIGSLRAMDIVKESGGALEMLVTLSGISVESNGNSTTALGTSITVLLDSGATLSYVPEDTANTIFSAVGASYSSRYGLAFVPCSLANSSDTVSFDFDGKIISAVMSSMVIPGGVSPNLDCTFGIVPQSSSTSAVSSLPYTLGDSFIRNAYIVYDLTNNQISLAQTNTNATTSNILEITTGTNAVPDVTGSAAPAATTLSGGSNEVQAVGPGSSSSSSAFAAPTFVAGTFAKIAVGAVIAVVAL